MAGTGEAEAIRQVWTAVAKRNADTALASKKGERQTLNSGRTGASPVQFGRPRPNNSHRCGADLRSAGSRGLWPRELLASHPQPTKPPFRVDQSAARSWTAVAERSADTALALTRRFPNTRIIRAHHRQSESAPPCHRYRREECDCPSRAIRRFRIHFPPSAH